MATSKLQREVVLTAEEELEIEEKGVGVGFKRLPRVTNALPQG